MFTKLRNKNATISSPEECSQYIKSSIVSVNGYYAGGTYVDKSYMAGFEPTLDLKIVPTNATDGIVTVNVLDSY